MHGSRILATLVFVVLFVFNGMKFLTEYDCVSSQRTSIILVKEENTIGGRSSLPRWTVQWHTRQSSAPTHTVRCTNGYLQHLVHMACTNGQVHCTNHQYSQCCRGCYNPDEDRSLSLPTIEASSLRSPHPQGGGTTTVQGAYQHHEIFERIEPPPLARRQPASM
jgi:hypothetical protein